ncbi:hypothetical protein BGZ99_008911 [Dissophora globulifera]|uniref:RGS domain-containing protein n=1 Tax=Dissophora globulifera TaxID=979702 RepID=A0A9P6R8C0_9FUNG|nr:hypothetical protein BGZ99_008911 [Dissophora globulifera]
MVDIIYDTEPEADPSVAVPLGVARRNILIIVGLTMTFIGLFSTLLFQQVSKRDHNLRQRGRYLVPLQGYAGTLFFAIIYAFQSFKYRFPCVAVYYGSYFGLIPFVVVFAVRAWRLLTRYDRNRAIYLSRFAEPGELAALDESQSQFGAGMRAIPETILMTSSSPEQDKVFELTQTTLEEIARSKKWYNWYRSVTDKQMFIVAITYMIITLAIALSFQWHSTMISVHPLSYTCSVGPEFIFPAMTTVLFLFVLSPFMIIQLRGITDGFGIRNELIFVSLYAVPNVILFFCMPLIAEEFTRKYLDKTTYVALILVAGHVASILIPLKRHFKEHPRHFAFIARVFQSKSNRDKPAGPDQAFTNGIDDNKRTGKRDRCANKATVTGNEEIPLKGSVLTGPKDESRRSPAPTLVPPAKLNNDERDDREAQAALNGGIGNINQTLKSLIRSQRRERFGLGGGLRYAANVDSKKTDWDEFMRTLDDRKLFNRLSKFTVREFCAENMRFLYEVSRLEKRAMQYEHLREMTSSSQEVLQSGADTDRDLKLSSLSKSSSTRTNLSVLTPLPVKFTLGTADEGSKNTPHRIKKIVSASSVSSTQPMLARRSSSSYVDESEPSSPQGSNPYPSLPDSGLASHASSSREVDVISLSDTTFLPLPMPPTLRTQFEYVYKSFIVSGGRLELNLSYDTLQEIHQKARRGEWHSSIFDSAIYEIQELLFRDVWPKFVTSSQGLNYQGVETPTSETMPLREVVVATTGTGHSAMNNNMALRAGSHLSPTRPFGQASSHWANSSTSIMQTVPKASLAKATSVRVAASGSTSEPRPLNSAERMVARHGAAEDEFVEEPSRTGFKTWLNRKSRTGIMTATLISQEGGTEEAVGIIEQSRKSMVERRSDTSGLYSSSIQNSMATPMRAP